MSKVVSALLAGIVIGVLIAPAKGSETRRKIIDGGADLRDDVNDVINEAADNLKSGIQSIMNQAKDLFQKGKEEINSLKKDLN
jgi:gas vesicle protein